jgi:hypothetical protein
VNWGVVLNSLTSKWGATIDSPTSLVGDTAGQIGLTILSWQTEAAQQRHGSTLGWHTGGHSGAERVWHQHPASPHRDAGDEPPMGTKDQPQRPFIRV